jgi:hypothetical protein
VEINGFTIGFFDNTHEGNCYGYWIACRGKKIALMTDHEACAMDSYLSWGRDYDVVIHDAQYTDEEYQQCIAGEDIVLFRWQLKTSQRMGVQHHHAHAP